MERYTHIDRQQTDDDAMIDVGHFSNLRPARAGSWWHALGFAGVLLVGVPVAAHAQINPFPGYKGPALTKADLAAGQAAAGKLLTEDQAEVGKSEDWANPTSGHKGRISVQRAFRRNGMECRALQSEIQYTKTSKPGRPLLLNVCRLQTGEWKLV